MQRRLHWFGYVARRPEGELIKDPPLPTIWDMSPVRRGILGMPLYVSRHFRELRIPNEPLKTVHELSEQHKRFERNQDLILCLSQSAFAVK